jgi:hypothetical protein
MIIVGVVALLIWGGMLGFQSFDYYRRAKQYGEQARGWREIASRGRWDTKFASECAEYFTLLTRKYRRAMWHPWMPVAPDPHAPGYDRWEEQERRAKKASARAIPGGVPPPRFAAKRRPFNGGGRLLWTV